jgi:hypothetical protein
MAQRIQVLLIDDLDGGRNRANAAARATARPPPRRNHELQQPHRSTTEGSVTAVVDPDVGRVVAGHGHPSREGIMLDWRGSDMDRYTGSLRDCRDHAGLWNTATTWQPLLPA